MNFLSFSIEFVLVFLRFSMDFLSFSVLSILCELYVSSAVYIGFLWVRYGFFCCHRKNHGIEVE